jgi:hypothetical protein
MLAGSVEDSKVPPAGFGKGARKCFSIFWNRPNHTPARPTPNQPPSDKIKLTRSELESYARKLLVESNPNALAAELSRMRLSPGGIRNDDDLEGANMSCRDAVEVVTRHSKKGVFKCSARRHVY